MGCVYVYFIGVWSYVTGGIIATEDAWINWCNDKRFCILRCYDSTNNIAPYPNLLYGWLRERARCSESCVLICYPSGQDGPILPARDCLRWSRKSEVLLAQSFGHIINPLLTKLVRSRWLDIGLILFWVFNGPRKNAKKNLGQYSAILTLRLKNNAYI